MMHGRGKSDSIIVAVKPTNEAERSAEEAAEPRVEAEGNGGPAKHAPGAESGISVSQALDRIRKVARERKQEKFTALFHHINLELLAAAFGDLKQNAAAAWTG